ncbi:MAG: phage portal protein [Lachnospiraceae bacterium]|nr:phage portal protein [Lachnospiraceae bacterium]
MDIQAARKLIKDYAIGHGDFVFRADIAERYYKNENDILYAKKEDGEEENNPLRNADNRIPHNFHGLLVNQKASYMFTYPPLFDVGNQRGNDMVNTVLGDKFPKVCKSLCVSASNNTVAWLHYWTDEEGFHYGQVDSRQIIPVWTEDLEKKLSAVLRVYRKILDDGKTYVVYEIWTDTQCQAFCHETSSTTDLLLHYSMMEHCIIDIEHAESEAYIHNEGRVPFIPFFNNDAGITDLQNIKSLIDAYDKVYSGFVDDLEDIQELIFILSGYGGTELNEFLKDLKKYKTVKLDDDGTPGLSTLTIDIPVEAREKMLELTRKAIFEQGQGIDPQPENYGNASGEALKFMYSLLELKAGLMETEFRLGFGEFIHAICKNLNISCERIVQTWTRNMIRNDAETASICSQSVGILSQKTIVKNHPFVEDPEKELKYLEEEKKKEQEEFEEQYSPFVKKQENDSKGDDKTQNKNEGQQG